MNNIKTFKHSGDMGDIIFSIPTIQALGGGILYLDPNGGESSPLVNWTPKKRTKLTLKSIEFMTPLLKMQNGIEDVRVWNGEEVDFDLDNFRTKLDQGNLAFSHLAAFGLDNSLVNKPWLNFPSKRQLPKPLVISRSVRYHGNYSYWEQILPHIKDHSIFIGFEKDHEIFEYTFDCKVDYYPTPTITDIAEVINSCERFICNAGLPHAIAEGLHHPLTAEVFRVFPVIIFPDKESSIYV